jgi:hypothetical protein
MSIAEIALALCGGVFGCALGMLVWRLYFGAPYRHGYRDGWRDGQRATWGSARELAAFSAGLTWPRGTCNRCGMPTGFDERPYCGAHWPENAPQ